jgi:hypothetical protein
VLVAIVSFFIIQDFPETATFLTAEERAFVVHRLKYQGQVKGAEVTDLQVAQAEEFQWKYVKDAFADWQIWVNIVAYWGVSYSIIALGTQLNLADCVPTLRDLSLPPDDS